MQLRVLKEETIQRFSKEGWIRVVPHLSARVSIEDYPYLSQFHWYAVWAWKRPYAVRAEIRDGRKHVIRMHREIAHTQPGYVCHHVNGITLDNRRENLQNMRQYEHDCLHRFGTIPEKI